jgi:hypothetical protein
MVKLANSRRRVFSAAAILLVLLSLAGCKGGPLHSGDYMYVGVPQVVLRDRVAAIFNKAGTATLGEKVEVLDRQRRFVRVRTPRKEEGWVELRNLITRDNYERFEKLTADNKDVPSQGTGVARADLNMHLEAVRDSDKFYQLAEGDKVDILRRAVGLRPTPEEMAAKQAAANAALDGTPQRKSAKKSTGPESSSEIARKQAIAGKPVADNSAKAGAKDKSTEGKPGSEDKSGKEKSAEAAPAEPAPQPYDDFWLVRSKKDGHVGWVLARMIDLDVPIEVAQYAEGQRINGAFALNNVIDSEQGQKTQYLLLMNQPKDGLVYDFDQIRVFTWNVKRHRYETGYRERNFMGFLPVRLTTQDFGRDGGVQPVFFINKKNLDGSVSERGYRLIGNVVRPFSGMVSQGGQAAQPEDPTLDQSMKKKKDKPAAGGKPSAPVHKAAVAAKGKERKPAGRTGKHR